MNKLILIKTNVNMKQIESIKVGVGGEILSAEVKTIKTVYNYEDRIEITTENINIQYRCLKVVDSIESGLELNY